MQVSFVIPVFNQLAHTKACRDALKTHVPNSILHEVIWVNDGSEDDCREYLDSLTGNHRVIHQSHNQGFAVATNTGAAVARGRWLCLLNNDVEITAGALAEILRVAENHRDAGIVGCVQVSSSDNSVDHAGIAFIDSGYPIHQRIDLETLQSGPTDRLVPAVTAACCLVDQKWFNNVGGLDQRYRNGFEDVDLCLRAREAGWKIYLANHCVVKHAVSASQGRGRHEYRNAQKFLERWGPRTAAIEQANDREEARRQQVIQARSARKSAHAEVESARRRILETDETLTRQRDTPPTIWVDLLRMEPQGANGGIKPLVFGFLEEMGNLTWEPMQFLILAQEGLAAELSFLRSTDVIALRSASSWIIHEGSAERRNVTADQLQAAFPADALYCPFGTSAFAREGLPTVALLVDSLHRDLPSALPLEEVNFREDNFKRSIGAANWIQTLAQHGRDRLQAHFDLHPTRCFYTYASVQDRLSTMDDQTARPSSLPDSKFFFYPANFWPHKNHEVLLTAYHQYRHQMAEKAWPLLLTGHSDERMKNLERMSVALGLADHVTFAGHLPDDAFNAVWHFAGALVFPSLHEGFGIPLVEAFQSRLPVLAARTSVLPEVGRDACAWFDPRDPHDLCATMTIISENAKLRDDLVRKGERQLPRFSRHYEAAKLNHFLHAAARGLVP